MATKKVRLRLAALALVCALATSTVIYADPDSPSEPSEETVDSTEEISEETPEESSGTGEDTELEEGEISHESAVEQAIVKDPNGTIMDHKLIAENSNYELYLKEENISIIMRDKKTGAIMESTVPDSEGLNATWLDFMQSGIAFEILEGSNNKMVGLGSAGAEISYKDVDNGFTADLNLTKYHMTLSVTVTLEEDGLKVVVPSDSITESEELVAGNRCYLGSLYVFPFLGYTNLGERDGYMVYPDGNGAMISLEDNEGKFGSPLYVPVYGENYGHFSTSTVSLMWNEYKTINDSEFAMAPVWGMVHTDTQMAYIGIMEMGDADAQIVVYPNGASTPYNWISPYFYYRRNYMQLFSADAETAQGAIVQEEKRNESDVIVKYLFTSGEDADWVGLAKEYRDYLIENGLEAKEDDFKVRLDFLGLEKENWLLFKTDVVMTTVEDIRDIYADLETEGVTDLFSVYKGWQKGGIQNFPIKSYKVAGSLGGKSKLNSLIQELKDSSIDFYLYQDALRANVDTTNTTFNVIKKMNERRYEEIDTTKQVYGTFVFQTPAQCEKLLKSSLSGYAKNDVTGLALAGITSKSFSFLYSGVQYSREYTLESFENSVKAAAEQMDVVLEEPISRFWKYADAIIDMPVGSSDYIYTTENIPFFAVVLKGLIPMYSDYVNFEANKYEFFLDLAVSGIYPSWYLTKEDSSELLYTDSNNIYSSKYTVYKDAIVDYYKQLGELQKAVDGAYIDDYEEYDSGMVVVTYTNGVKVYANYSEEKVTEDGVSVDALSFVVE